MQLIFHFIPAEDAFVVQDAVARLPRDGISLDPAALLAAGSQTGRRF